MHAHVKRKVEASGTHKVGYVVQRHVFHKLDRFLQWVPSVPEAVHHIFHCHAITSEEAKDVSVTMPLCIGGKYSVLHER
jgi:hypothetical protein